MKHCFLLTVESEESDPNKVLEVVNGRLGEAQQACRGGMIGPAAVDVSVESVVASQTVTIEDMGTGTLTVEVGAKWGKDGFFMMPRGYGEYSVPPGEGSPVRLAVHHDTLLLEYCSNINDDHIELVPLDEAKDKVG